MRSTRTLLLGILLVALAACGGPAGASTAESTGGEPSSAASTAESPEASPDDGPGATDVDTLLAELAPPNSEELSTTTVPQGTAVAYESTDTVGDLRGFYIQKIAELNLDVVSTNEAANSYAVVIAAEGLGGTIVVQNVGDVSNVLVTIGEAS